jgi:hypothetical protein
VSQGITHFAFGAVLTTVIVTFLVPAVRYPRVWVLVGGVWAMLPDATKLLDRPLLHALHDGPWADVFWLHGTMDVADPGDSTLFGAVAIGLFVLATALAEHRSYRRPAAVGELLDPGSD